MSDIEVIVTRPGTKGVIVIDPQTRKLLFFTETYSRNITPGKYRDPNVILEIFRELATRGHNTRKGSYDPPVFEMLKQILLSDLPYETKKNELYKYIRAS